MRDNFDTIARILDSKNLTDDEFLFCQVIIRKKDIATAPANNVVIQSYFIKNSEHLFSLKEEIIKLCELFKARAYINLNRCSYEKLAFKTLQCVTDKILNKDYKSIKRAYTTVCGRFKDEPEPTFVVDIDDPSNRFMNEVLSYIERECDPIGPKFKWCIPTKSGHHLITKPFNLAKFKEKYPDIDIHKNNPTILYC